MEYNYGIFIGYDDIIKSEVVAIIRIFFTNNVIVGCHHLFSSGCASQEAEICS